MTHPDNHLLALGAATLVTFGGLIIRALMHQDAPVTAAWREAVDDGSKFGASFAKAVRETVRSGPRIGGTDAATLA